MPARPPKARRGAPPGAGGGVVRGVSGEVRFDTTTRAAYASDSSNYRHVPLGVVFPVDHDDVRAAARLAAEAGAALLARGAGTSLAGQACNEAVVLDMSRHMTRIVEIDPDRRVARANRAWSWTTSAGQPSATGSPSGRIPPPMPGAPSAGMIGNNSCGTHGLYAGKTSDNVESLRVVLAGGEELEVGAYTPARHAGGHSRGRPASACWRG